MKKAIVLRLRKIKNIFNGSESKIGKLGHLGTHFDVMDKEFPLEYIKRKGIIFDVSSVQGRDIDITDINWDKISV